MDSLFAVCRCHDEIFEMYASMFFFDADLFMFKVGDLIVCEFDRESASFGVHWKVNFGWAAER